MAETETRFVGSVPVNYDTGLGPVIFESYAAEMARRTQAVAPGRVLELAAGTGIVSRHLRDTLPDTTGIVVTDLNEPMIEHARTKFTSGENVIFETVDATDLPYEDDSFDAVICQFGIMFFPEKDRGFREALRVLRPGGTYLVTSWDSWAENPFAQVTQETVESFFPDDPPGFYHVPFSYHDPDAFSDALGRAGFVDVAVEHVARSQPIPSVADFARGLVMGNPLYQEIVARGGDADAVLKAMEVAIGERLPNPMPLKSLFVTARKP